MLFKRIVPIIALIFLVSCSEEQDYIQPTIEDMTESVYASVSIVPKDMYDVYTVATGIIDSIAVTEGDTVKKGQLIAIISSDATQVNKENAMLNLNLAKERLKGKANILEKLQEQIEASSNQLELDSINYFRQLRLMEQNVGSKIDLQVKKLKYELSKSNRNILLKEYQQSKIELSNGFKQSKNLLELAKSNLGDYLIKSDIDGTLYSLLKEKGELISPQTPIAQIGRTGDFLIEMRIDEVDIAKIDLGQKVIITLDSYKRKTFSGYVSKIYPIKDERTQTFKVEAIFDEAPEKLYAGLSGEANVIISTKKNVMTIPLGYLTADNQVITENGKKSVKIGLQNMDKVEIISGIDSTTKIEKP